MSENNDAKHVLLVLISHSDLGGVRPTGFYVDEAAHPWQVFRRMGFTVGLASIAGGVPPQAGRHPVTLCKSNFCMMRIYHAS